MQEFLIGFDFHEPERFAQFQRGIIEDFESSTGLFVEADNQLEAMAWAEIVAAELLKHLNHDPTLDWKAMDYSCWVEEIPESSSWKHCLSFFQRVKVGEMPDLTQMGTPAYIEWAKQHGIKC